MSDNVNVTPGSGAAVATDLAGGAHHQVVKLAVGVADSVVRVGHLEDAAHASGDGGIMLLAVRNDAGTVLAGTSGDYIPLSVDADGFLRVNVAAGAAGGTEYAEGATDATITGVAMLWEDTGDALATVSAATPLPVEMVAGSLDLAASEDHVGQVGGAAVVVRPAVTVTAGAYSAGDVVGGELTLTGAVRVTSGSGVLQSLTMHTADGEAPELWILLFDSAPGAALADNAAYAWTAGDEDKLLGAIHVETADWLTVGGDGVLSRNNLGIAVKANGGTALYAYVVCVGTPTFAATTDVTMALTFLQD